MTKGQPWVLLVTKNDFSEASDGGSKRVNAVVNAIEAAGFTVEAVPGVIDRRPELPSAGAVREVTTFLRVLGSYLRAGSLSSIKWLRYSAVRQIVRTKLAYDSAPAATVIEFTQMLAYHTAVTAPILVDMHNVESGLLKNYADSATSPLRRLVATYETGRMRAIERRVATTAASVIFVSDADRASLEKEWKSLPGKTPSTAVAPNGVDAVFFEYAGDRDGTVVFVGHLGWQPNVDAAVWLAREVWPAVLRSEPSARLLLVGRRPARAVRELACDSIEIHADVPSVVDYFGKAAVSVAPLLAAGGTRIKILESLGAGTPVVATPMGALGLEPMEGDSLRVAETPDDLADAIIRVSTAPSPARDAARSLVADYRWNHVLAPLTQSLAELAR